MRASIALAIFFMAVSPALAAGEAAKDGKGAPGTNVELPVLIAPMNGTDGKLVSYAYVSGTLTASTPGDALTVRDRIAFVQDAFVRDVNGAPITRSDDVTQVDKAGLAARLLADARRIIGAARVKAVVIDRVQIAPLHPTQSPEQAPPPAPAPPAAPQQDAAVAKEK
jgi:hypothetical protein